MSGLIKDTTPEDWDAVNRPEHYNSAGVECIDYIKQQLGEDFKAYLLGNCMKYIHRHKYKNSPKQDLEKASWYLDRLIELTD